MPSSTLDPATIPQEQCDALFAAVLAHDDIHLDAELPDAIHLDYTPEQFTACYRICRQIWRAGVKRSDLIAIIDKIRRHRSLGPQDQLAFKNIRARFKHLRFACVTFDEGHRYPFIFHCFTAVMGHLQDVFKNQHQAAAGRAAILLRVLLTRLPYAWLSMEIGHFTPSTTEAFRGYVNSQIGFLRSKLAQDEVTSQEFHDIRKVISRQVALYDNLKIVYPSDYHRDVSRYLSTINGMMGGVHDELIAKRLEGTHDYHANAFRMPREIKQRLIRLTGAYGKPHAEAA